MLVYSTTSEGFTTAVRGDREYVRADAMTRGIAAGFAPEQIERALKRYRAA